MAADSLSVESSEWDARHQAAAGGLATEPASLVVELLPLLPRGPALDLACGTGRHALLLAARQQPVTAVDSLGEWAWTPWNERGRNVLTGRSGLQTTRLAECF